MIRRKFRALAAAATMIASSPALAGANVSLVPFKGPIRFTPHMPQAVSADHPLAGRVVVDPVANMPNSVGGFLNRFVSARELNRALGDTLAEAGMRGGAEQSAPFRLFVTWVSLDSPFKIGTSSRAAVTLRYELRRTDSGAVIFRRDITTSAEASGGNAADRQRGTARAALAANLAGAIWCMDLAAYGRAPENCALSPTGRFAAPISVYVPSYR